MRIIGGAAKGRRLQAPPPQQQHRFEIRPTSDRAREALFNILGEVSRGATVLDLFAGCGALGLEALSRGAKAVVFVDKNTPAVELIKTNCLRLLSTLPAGGSTADYGEIRLLQQDLRQPLQRAELPQEMRRFELIFADPPYDSGLAAHILTEVAGTDLLQPGGILVVEERHTTPLPSQRKGLYRTEVRRYGKAAFHLYRQTAP